MALDWTEPEAWVVARGHRRVHRDCVRRRVVAPQPQAPPPPWRLTRVTADPGLSDFAALAPQVSDRTISRVRVSPDSNWRMASSWLTPPTAAWTASPISTSSRLLDGQAIRLTSDGAGNTTPDFSPDGSKIVFRSNRDGGGVYEIPAFGEPEVFVGRLASGLLG